MDRLLVLIVAGMACVAAVQAQQPSLDELQKRLDAAKQAQQQRDAAQKAEAARRAADQRAGEAEQRAQTMQSGRLVIEADAACELRINGERKQVLRAREPTTIMVLAGEQLIDCQSRDEREVTVREVRKLDRGAQVVVMLSLAGQVTRQAKEREQRDAVARRTAQEAAQKEAACQSNQAMMEERGSGVLRQCVTSLEWTQSDNGSDVNWQNAMRYCEARGGGWRLPLVSELLSIIDQNGTLTVGCGSYRGTSGVYGGTSFTCRVSSAFRLTGSFAWSSEQDGESRAWGVLLDDGRRNAIGIGVTNFVRALCVRRL